MNTTLIISVIIILALLTLVYLARVRMKNLPLVADNEKILILTNTNFMQQTKGKVVLVDFWAEWCAPCRMMAPILNETANELSEKQRIGKVDIEQQQLLAKKYQIRSIPTMILFQNGVEVERIVGVKSKEYLIKQINKY